jgi:hypothetical protein
MHLCHFDPQDRYNPGGPIKKSPQAVFQLIRQDTAVARRFWDLGGKWLRIWGRTRRNV